MKKDKKHIHNRLSIHMPVICAIFYAGLIITSDPDSFEYIFVVICAILNFLYMWWRLSTIKKIIRNLEHNLLLAQLEKPKGRWEQ